MFSPSSTTGLLYPLMMLLMSILSTPMSGRLYAPALTVAGHSLNGSGLEGQTNYFLVFYEALVLWGYTATAATQDQTEGKIIFIKFVDRHPLHSVLSLRHRPTPNHCHCLAQPGRHTARPLTASAAAIIISATHSLVSTLAHT